LLRQKQPENKKGSGLTRVSLTALVRSSRFITVMIFLFTTLILWVVGRDVAFVREDIMMIELYQTYPFNLAKIFTDGWTGLYGSAFPWIDWSYRPLEMVIDWGLVNILGESGALQILFKSAIAGGCAVLVYILAMELTRKRPVALASAVCFVFSVPVIIESWWCRAGCFKYNTARGTLPADSGHTDADTHSSCLRLFVLSLRRQEKGIPQSGLDGLRAAVFPSLNLRQELPPTKNYLGRHGNDAL